jgi:predicted nucleotidyltransferase
MKANDCVSQINSALEEIASLEQIMKNIMDRNYIHHIIFFGSVRKNLKKSSDMIDFIDENINSGLSDLLKIIQSYESLKLEIKVAQLTSQELATIITNSEISLAILEMLSRNKIEEYTNIKIKFQRIKIFSSCDQGALKQILDTIHTENRAIQIKIQFNSLTVNDYKNYFTNISNQYNEMYIKFSELMASILNSLSKL